MQDSAYGVGLQRREGQQDPHHRAELPRHHHTGPGRYAGITPANISRPGPIGLVSKSGTLTYQMMYELRDFGFSTCHRHRW